MSATACESVSAVSAQRGALRSAKRRYALASGGHLARVESSPSTLMTVGMPARRVTRHSGLLPAMKNSATSGLSVRAACVALSSVCTKVSRYLLRTVGRWTRRAPRQWRRRGVGEARAGAVAEAAVDHVRAAVDDDLVPALRQAVRKLLGGRLEARVG